MNEIRKLWESIKNTLHHGPSTQPLWQAMVDKMHEFENRIKELEEKIVLMQTPTQPVPVQSGGQLPPPIIPVEVAPTPELHIVGSADVSTEQAKPTEEVIHQDAPVIGPSGEIEQPAAASANDSSAAGDNAGPDSPTAKPEPDGAGQDNSHAHEEGHDEKGSGEQHGE